MKRSSHKDKKWSGWKYDSSQNQYYRYHQTRNGDYEYDLQPASAAPTAEETQDTPKTAANVEIERGLNELDIGDDYAEEETSYTTRAAQTRRHVPSSGYEANWYQEVSSQLGYEELAYDDESSPQGPVYPETDHSNDAYDRCDGTEDDQESQGGQPTTSYAESVSSMDSTNQSSPARSKGKGKEIEDDAQVPQSYDDGDLYEADDSISSQSLATSTLHHYTQLEDFATGSSSGDWTIAPESTDDLAELKDEAFQAAKQESSRYLRHPHTDHEGGPSSAPEHYYTQTPSFHADHEGLSSGSAHGYEEAQDFDEGDVGGQTTPTQGDHRGIISIQNELGDQNQLDPRYRVEHSTKFLPGKIFKVHWPQPRGASNSKSRVEAFYDRFGELFYVQFRRFVIVGSDDGHSQCVPITTYGGQACKKKGVKAKKHGIIYQQGHEPRLLDGEPPLGFRPIKVKITEEDEKLSKESRINYSKLSTVEHNVKVHFIGRLATKSDLAILHKAVNSCWEQMISSNRRRG